MASIKAALEIAQNAEKSFDFIDFLTLASIKAAQHKQSLGTTSIKALFLLSSIPF